MENEKQENPESREGKGRTAVKPTGGRDRHPAGWSAFCKSPGCSGYANFRCPECKKPTCNGCAREWETLSENSGLMQPEMKMICGACYEAL